jgi:hypothetical protein
MGSALRASEVADDLQFLETIGIDMRLDCLGRVGHDVLLLFVKNSLAIVLCLGARGRLMGIGRRGLFSLFSTHKGHY